MGNNTLILGENNCVQCGLIIKDESYLRVHKHSFLYQLGPNSGLHIIIFDEIDAICKSRGSVVSLINVFVRTMSSLSFH